MAAEMGGPGSDVEHHHHHQTGHRWLDVTLGVSAIFISLMSLLLALQHGRAMEKMVEMSSWPYVSIDYSTITRDARPRMSMEIANNGVGPAAVESVEVFYRDVPQSDPKALIRAMLKVTDPARGIDALQSDVIGTVLPARDSRVLFDVLLDRFTPEEYQTLRHESAELTWQVCYCSVFEECSVLDGRKAAPKPEHVKACPVPKVMFLH
jgi:hypothetical protein